MGIWRRSINRWARFSRKDLFWMFLMSEPVSSLSVWSANYIMLRLIFNKHLWCLPRLKFWNARFWKFFSIYDRRRHYFLSIKIKLISSFDSSLCNFKIFWNDFIRIYTHFWFKKVWFRELIRTQTFRMCYSVIDLMDW